MYKRILSIMLSILSLVLIYSVTPEVFKDPESTIIISFLLLTFILFVNRENKGHVYNIITLLLTILSGIFVLYASLIFITEMFSYGSCESICLLVTTFSISALIIINIIDFKKKPNNINLILNIVVTMIISLVVIRACLNTTKIDNMTYLDIDYIYNNYIYFSILTSCLLIHYFVNRKKTN